MDPQSQATALKKNIALADLEYDPVPDELKSKMERSWDRLHDYSLALIDWVETTRSRTLVPLKVHLFDPLDAAKRASGDSTDIYSLLAHLPEGEGFAKRTLSRIQTHSKLSELRRRLAVVEDGLDRLERIKQSRSQVFAITFKPWTERASAPEVSAFDWPSSEFSRR